MWSRPRAGRPVPAGCAAVAAPPAVATAGADAAKRPAGVLGWVRRTAWTALLVVPLAALPSPASTQPAREGAASPAAAPDRSAAAAPEVRARLGRHDTFTRIAFTWPEVPDYTLTERGDGGFVLRFTQPARLDFRQLAASPPRHLSGLELLEDGFAFVLAPGASLRPAIFGRVLALDILDPPRPTVAAPAAPTRAAVPPPPRPGPPGDARPGEPAAAPAVEPSGARSSTAAPRPATPAAESRSAAPAGQAGRERAASAPEADRAALAAALAQLSQLGVVAPAGTPPAAEAARRDPPPPPAPMAAAAPTPSPASTPSPAPTPPPSPTPVAAPTPPAAAAPPPGAAAVSRGAAAARPLEAGPGTARLSLPFPPDTGAAVVPLGSTLLLVFDRPGNVPVDDLRRLAPSFATAEIEVSGGTTQLRLPLEAADRAGIQLLPGPAGWQLGVPAAGELVQVPEMSLAWPAAAARTLVLRGGDIGRVVALRHPVAEGVLLVGTVPGSAPARLAAPLPEQDGVELLPTRLGVALRPLSPEAQLRPAADGFTVSLPRGDGRQIGLSSAPDPRRLLDLADVPRGDLLKRRQVAQAAASAAEPDARGGPRVVLAEALLGLGLGTDAQSLARLAMRDDPRLAGLPRALLLAGAASLLSGRDAEAAPLLGDARLNGEPEARLWRALAAAQRGMSVGPEALAALADERALLRAYPPALRSRLVPAAVEALAVGGSHEAAAELLNDPEIAALPRVALARARLLEARGQADAAIRDYAALSRNRDGFVRAAALARGAELELANGRIDARRAAARTEAAAMAWRGDGRELARRLRAAELYTGAGQHGAALTLLEQTAAVFPDAASRLRPMLESAFPAAVADPTLSLGEANRLAGRMLQALPLSPQTNAALLAVADRLVAMELPAQAAELLRLGLTRTTDASLRAALSMRLAAAMLAADEPASALEALAGAPLAAVPPAARDDRIRLEAEARRRRGDLAGAAGLLRDMGPAGTRPLIEVLAAQEDWRGAAEALAAHARQTLPPAPAPLDLAQRRILLRLAAFASLAGDPAQVEALRAQYAARLAGGPLAEAFLAMLGVEATPQRGGTAPDLAALRREVATARSLQEGLSDLR